MARRSSGLAKNIGPRSSSKRSQPQELPESSNVSKRPRRQASAANLKSTPAKSQYFEGSSESEEEESTEDSQSAFGEDDVDEPETGSDQATDDNISMVEDDETHRKGKGLKQSRTQHVWKEGVKAGLGPGTQVIIKKPKARSAGSTSYENETIHPNTLLFLKDLKANNNRPWLKAHDPDYRQSEQDWKSYVEAITEKIAEVDETIPELPYKDVVFRIYRDVRFSKDPTPYKAHFSAAWSRTGRKGPYAAYYIQVQPNGQSLVAGGLWMPEASALAKLRHSIDRHPERLKQVLMEDRLRREFLKGAPKQEVKVAKVFCDHNASSALKTKPKGYDPDHVDIGLLRLKSFTLSKRLPDDEITHASSLQRVMELISCLVPFITYLNSVVMPDEETSNEEDEDENESDSDAA